MTICAIGGACMMSLIEQQSTNVITDLQDVTVSLADQRQLFLERWSHGVCGAAAGAASARSGRPYHVPTPAGPRTFQCLTHPSLLVLNHSG
ncbi:MAG: hypothetical protein LC769_04650, partial [Chloroflexi bacterium]|nr:hypothetical protein [Chloroflexota bacterium]